MVTHDFLTHTTTLDFGPHNVHINMATHNITTMLDLDFKKTLLDAFCGFHSKFHNSNFYLPKPLINNFPCSSMGSMLFV
jgi:hypothetical protein